LKSPLCDMLGIEFPLFAFSHCRDVVAAVSRAGGFGVLGAATAWPILSTLAHTHDATTAFALVMAGMLIVSLYTSINAIVKAELFPTKVRALGVGLPYAITVSVFGGTAPAVALYFKSLGHEDWFYYYLSGMIFLSLIIYTTMRDTKHESAMHRHE